MEVPAPESGSCGAITVGAGDTLAITGNNWGEWMGGWGKGAGGLPLQLALL